MTLLDRGNFSKMYETVRCCQPCLTSLSAIADTWVSPAVVFSIDGVHVECYTADKSLMRHHGDVTTFDCGSHAYAWNLRFAIGNARGHSR